MEKRISPWVAISLAILIGLMVVVLLNNVLQPVTVVVAKVALAPGTLLTSRHAGTAHDPCAGPAQGCFQPGGGPAGQGGGGGPRAGRLYHRLCAGEFGPGRPPLHPAARSPGRGGQGRSGQRRGRAAARRADGDFDRDALAGRAAKHSSPAGCSQFPN